MEKERKRSQIKFTVDGVDYVLEFTPRSIRKMEDDGFDLTNIDKRVINSGYDLFRGAFISRHNYVPMSKRDELYDELAANNESEQNLVKCLADMLVEEIEYISSKPQGNVSWVME